MKAADSLIIFFDNGAQCTAAPSKMLYRCEKSSSKRSNLQDSEIEVRWETIDRITK